MWKEDYQHSWLRSMSRRNIFILNWHHSSPINTLNNHKFLIKQSIRFFFIWNTIWNNPNKLNPHRFYLNNSKNINSIRLSHSFGRGKVLLRNDPIRRRNQENLRKSFSLNFIWRRQECHQHCSYPIKNPWTVPIDQWSSKDHSQVHWSRCYHYLHTLCCYY